MKLGRGAHPEYRVIRVLEKRMALVSPVTLALWKQTSVRPPVMEKCR